MKRFFRLFSLLGAGALVLFSCTDDTVTDMGSQVQPEADGIVVEADTFHLQSSNYYPEYIYSSTDSFLLGNYYDPILGETEASIFAQLACPLIDEDKDSRDFVPAGAVADSVELSLYYRSFFGEGNAPVKLSVYEMNKGTFAYTGDYPSNLNVTDYCDTTLLLGERLLTADNPKDSVGSGDSYVSRIRIKLSKEFAERFFDIENDTYHSFENFNDFFNGLYLTSPYGTDVMFHVIQIDMDLHYHYATTIAGRDTIVNNVKTYPANAEVRQVNKISHPDIAEVKQRLDAIDSLNYVSSPANVYTRVTLPIGRMCDSVALKIGDRVPYINRSALKVEVDEIDYKLAALPSNSMMLIKASAIDRFFTSNESLSDTCAIVATIEETQVDATTYEYHYSFDISTLVQETLEERHAKNGSLATLEDLDMLLVPVRLETETSGTQSVIIGVEPEYLMTTTVLKSAQNATAPMKLNMVYSGF